MGEIQNYVKKLELGKTQVHKNMKIVPLMGKNSGLEYLTFDEAVNSGLQISETGSVPTLHFKNNTGKEVLILQGEYVIGGKQNRMVASNVYMAKNFDGDIPVRCVEQGRWHFGGGSVFPTGLRVRDENWPFPTDGGVYGPNWLHHDSNLSGDTSFKSGRMASRAVMFAAAAGQGEVWNQVNYLSADHNVKSATQNLDDVFREKQGDLGEYISGFEYAPGSVGMVVAFQDKSGQIRYGVDMFDQGETMKKNFRKLLESYALEAIAGGANIKGTKKDAEEFLSKIQKAKFDEKKPISLGRDFVILGNGIEGLALQYEKTPLYVTFKDTRQKNQTGPHRPNGPLFFGPVNNIPTGFYRR